MRMPVFSYQASATAAGSGSPALTQVRRQPGTSCASIERYAVGAVNSVVIPYSPIACSMSPGLATGAVEAPKRSGKSTRPPSPNVNASGGVPLNTSLACGSSTCFGERVAAGEQVAVEVHAALRLAGRAGRERDDRDVVGGGVDGLEGRARGQRPRARGREAACPRARELARPRHLARQLARRERDRRLRLRHDLRDLPRAQQRHRRHHDPARQQDAEPGRDRLRRVGRVQQHARRRARSPSAAATAVGALAQLRIAPAAGDRHALVPQQLGRRVHPRRPVQQQQVRPGLRRRQAVAGERVGHRSSSRAMISCWTSDAPS